MPKLKTNKATASRFRITGGGKVMRMYGNKNKYRRKKRQEITVLYGRTVDVAPGTARRVRRALAAQ